LWFKENLPAMAAGFLVGAALKTYSGGGYWAVGGILGAAIVLPVWRWLRR
jgi:hypothetical protein